MAVKSFRTGRAFPAPVQATACAHVNPKTANHCALHSKDGTPWCRFHYSERVSENRENRIWVKGMPVPTIKERKAFEAHAAQLETMSEPKKPRGFFGISVVVDPKQAPATALLKDASGRVVARLINIGAAS